MAPVANLSPLLTPSENMHVTDLAINKTLGMQLAPADHGHILEMPESPLLLNHVGTVHASVQFALAEASSGEFLLRHLGETKSRVFAVLRTSEVKFRKPAHGALRASARFADGMADLLASELASRGRTLASVLVEVADAQGVVTMTGKYDWFLQRHIRGNAANPGEHGHTNTMVNRATEHDHAALDRTPQ